MDFTVKKYEELLKSLIQQNYTFQTFKEFLIKPESKCIILRHDVDLLPYNSLLFAEIQNDLGIRGVYYFRAVPESWNEEVIMKISDLGHEIGYHYENLTTCNGDMSKGIKDFETNLAALRKLVSVSTICMHGSPMSKYDSKDLWRKYDYKNYSIIGEPYFDVDFKEVFYITDTGRRWDGLKVSVRDKVNSTFKLSFNSTQEIIECNNKNGLPNKIMFTFHPQRWHNNFIWWSKELVFQNLKNIIKKIFYVEATHFDK